MLISREHSGMKNFSVIALLCLTLSGCGGWFPGRQHYWDAKVREMCEKDGGVRIFEKLRLSKADVQLLTQGDGKIGVPVKSLANPNSPAYTDLTISEVHNG